MTRTLLALVKASHLAVADVEEAKRGREGKGSRTVGGLFFLVECRSNELTQNLT